MIKNIPFSITRHQLPRHPYKRPPSTHTSAHQAPITPISTPLSILLFYSHNSLAALFIFSHPRCPFRPFRPFRLFRSYRPFSSPRRGRVKIEISLRRYATVFDPPSQAPQFLYRNCPKSKGGEISVKR